MIWPFEAKMTNSVFTGNSTYNSGGAIQFNHKTFRPAELSDCTFNSNSAKNGGAISSHEVDLFISKNRFLGNTASTGAAVSTFWAQRTWMIDSTLTGNRSPVSSASETAPSILYLWGATWNTGHEIGTSTGYVMNSQFQNNEASGPTGAVLIAANSKVILNSSSFENPKTAVECKIADSTIRNLGTVPFLPSEFVSLGGNTSKDGSCPN